MSIVRLPMHGPCLGALILLSGCATQPAPVGHGPSLAMGLVHGFLAIPGLLVGLVTDRRIYAFPNSGLDYDFGFCIGFSISLVAVILAALPYIGGYLTRNR